MQLGHVLAIAVVLCWLGLRPLTPVFAWARVGPLLLLPVVAWTAWSDPAAMACAGCAPPWVVAAVLGGAWMLLLVALLVRWRRARASRVVPAVGEVHEVE